MTTGKLEQAARQALDALEVSTDWDVGAKGKQLQSMKAITALREALEHPVKLAISEEAFNWIDANAPMFVREALAEQAEQEPVAIGNEWKPCMKLPIVVHVREQREGETHVSTREGITPILPTDLIMRGVAGEEYPIGYELFNKTYTFEIAAPVQPVKQEVIALLNVALEALVYHTEQTRPIHKTDEAISQIQNFLDKGATK